MLPVKKPFGLVLAGLAAFAYYKYNKMTPEQRRDLANNLKEKGRKIFGSIIPSEQDKGMNSNPAYGKGSNYPG